MPPRTLNNFKYGSKGAEIRFEADTPIHRPQHAVLVAHVISLWAATDSLFPVLTGEFLHADFEVVGRMLEALSGAEARRAAIKAAAMAALADRPENLDLFNSVIKVIQPSRIRRNQFSHFSWGYIVPVGDALLLADPKCFTEYDAARRSQRAGIKQSEPLDYDKILVFRKRDLEEEVRAAQFALRSVKRLWQALSSRRDAAQARKDLLAEPKIVAAMARSSAAAVSS